MGDVLLGYLHPNEVSASFHKSLLDLIGYDLSGPRRLHSWAMVKCGIDVAGGRNDLASKFLDSDCDWLFMLDADMAFEPNTLDALLSVANAEHRPIVGGLAFAQRESVPDGMNGFRCFPRPTLLDWVPNDEGVHRFIGKAHYPVNTLMRVGATGGAILLIHRSVFERLSGAFGRDVFFDQSHDALGQKMGEDISFFDRCRQLDIPLWVHTGIRTTHYKHLWLGEDDFWQSFIPPPATERVDVIVPVLHRPQNVKPFMESLIASTGLATAWFVCEPGDTEEMQAVRSAGGEVLVDLVGNSHTFAEKVNYAYRELENDPAPWVLLVGDDVRFRPSWVDHAQDVARRYGADVIGTNDLCNPRVIRGEHATHPMIRRSYIDDHGASWDGPGVICHEGYRHWFVDDEIVMAARQRGAFQPALGSQVEHLHPLTGAAEWDDVYEAGNKHAKSDQGIYEQRLRKFVG
jgi:hypothetical protein